VTSVLHFGAAGVKHRSAALGSTHYSTSNMLLSKPGPLSLCAGIAFACSTLIAACGDGGGLAGEEFHGLATFDPASMVLGQTSFAAGQANGGTVPSASSFEHPLGMALTPAGGMLIADSGNNRVLFYSSTPQATGAGADAVLGQPGFNSADAAVTQTGLSAPGAVAVGAGRMAIADTGANRVLIYDRIPAAGEPMPVPSVVIGQPGFQSSAESCGASGLRKPTTVAITPEGKLLVGDWGNYRILVWNSIPAPGAAVPPPSLVLGQSDADHCGFADDDQDGSPDIGVGGIISHVTGRIMAPVDIWTDGKRLVVADGDFDRVLIWNTFPTVPFQPADVVLGQRDFTGRWPNGAITPGDAEQPGAKTFSAPRGVHSDGTSLAVADLANNRVLVWSTFPVVNQQAADIVLGHAGFEQGATNDLNNDRHADAPSAQVLDRPSNVMFSPGALFVSDLLHHRVLKFRR